MTHTLYYTATSADGFIADADGSLDWLRAVPHAEGDDSWDEFISGIGVLVMGGTSGWSGVAILYLDAGLLDEVVLSVVPALGVTPVLARRLTSERLELREVRQLGQRVRITFGVTPAAP